MAAKKKAAAQKRKRKANASPTGGGGGGWAKMNRKMAASRQARQAKRPARPEAVGKGLAIGTQAWVRNKIEAGELDGGMSSGQTGTSIFDPVLCELVYRWFCPSGGLVLDPFAGGSVRGVVASKLGRRYLGVDLSKRQVEANRVQAAELCKKPVPEWLVGDSRNLAALASGREADFVFSCPPYADLERYSDDKRDLSTMEYPDFREAYRHIIQAACSLLKPNRFACFVVGDVRDERGMYYGFPWHTVEAFQAAGLGYYNEAVLVTAVGSLPIRAGKQFANSRKMGKTHQNVLVFAKGDPVAAAKAIGVVEFGDPMAMMGGEQTPFGLKLDASTLGGPVA